MDFVLNHHMILIMTTFMAIHNYPTENEWNSPGKATLAMFKATFSGSLFGASIDSLDGYAKLFPLITSALLLTANYCNRPVDNREKWTGVFYTTSFVSYMFYVFMKVR